MLSKLNHCYKFCKISLSKKLEVDALASAHSSHRFLSFSYVKSCWLGRHATALGLSALSARLDSHQNMEPARDIRARWNTTSLFHKPPLLTPRPHALTYIRQTSSWQSRRLKFSHFHTQMYNWRISTSVFIHSYENSSVRRITSINAKSGASAVCFSWDFHPK